MWGFYIGGQVLDTSCSGEVPQDSIFELLEFWSLKVDENASNISPIVGDIDGDGIPEILAISEHIFPEPKRIYIIDGLSGKVEDTLDLPESTSLGSHLMSIADVDRDGNAEIFTQLFRDTPTMGIFLTRSSSRRFHDVGGR